MTASTWMPELQNRYLSCCLAIIFNGMDRPYVSVCYRFATYQASAACHVPRCRCRVNSSIGKRPALVRFLLLNSRHSPGRRLRQLYATFGLMHRSTTDPPIRSAHRRHALAGTPLYRVLHIGVGSRALPVATSSGQTTTCLPSCHWIVTAL